MLKQAFGSTFKIAHSTVNRGQLSSLCTRLTLLSLGARSFHTKPHVKHEQQEIQQIPHDQLQLQQREQKEVEKQPKHGVKKRLQAPDDITKHLAPSELLRQEALKIEEASALRPRCAWLPEEDEKLLRLVEEEGKRWTYMSYFFVDRSPSTLMNRYFLLTDKNGRGPWSKKEVEIIKKVGAGRTPEEIDESNGWEEFQEKLPHRRPLFLIKQKYTYSLNPSIKFGLWTEEESDKLTSLVAKYGEKNMALIGSLMKTRTKRQCLERWRWQLASTTKGRFSPEEDEMIVKAVKQYGENFAVVKKVIGSDRTARHISQHYRHMLAPGIDRSPWSADEQLKVYQVCVKNEGDMIKTKAELGSNRAIRDLWNHFAAQKRLEEFEKNRRRETKTGSKL